MNIKNRFKQYSKSKRTFLLTIIGIITCIVSLAIWIYLQNNKYIDSLPETGDTKTVIVSISSPTEPIVLGTSVSLDVMFDAGGATSTAITVELNYDPSKLLIESVTQGTFFTKVLAPSKIEGGKVSFTYAVPPQSGGKLGSGKLAAILVKPLQGGSSIISFTSITKASSIGNAGDVLKTATGITLNVQVPITPTITPTGTVVPTITITSTPGLTPTFTPVVTPTDGVEEFICGPIDMNNDNKLTIYDFTYFARAYTKTCADQIIYDGCGGKDTNSDTIIDIYDFIYLADHYGNVTESCLE